MLLQLYLITEILAPFFASLVILTGVLFLGRLVPMLDTLVGLGIGAADFIRLCAYLAPKLLLFAIPMASMTGVIIAFTRIAHDNELLAMNAGGLGIVRMLPAVLIVAVCTTLLNGVASASLFPQGTIALKRLFFELAREKIHSGIEPRQFSTGIRSIVFFVDRIDRDTDDWHGIYVSDFRDQDNPATIVAQHGRISAKNDEMRFDVTLRNGNMHRAAGNLSQTILFEEYRLILPLELPDELAGKKAEKLDRNSLTLSELRRESAALSSAEAGGRALLIEFHKRLALPVGGLVLSLLGLPLTLRSRPQTRSLAVTMGLLFFVSYYLLTTVAKILAEKGGVPVAMAIWTPDALFGLLALYLLRQTHLEGIMHRERRSLARRLATLVRAKAASLAAKRTGRP